MKHLDSAATIIGAMIIAPLMNPIVTLAYSVVDLSPQLLKRSIFSLSTGIVLVIFISYFITEFMGLRTVASEILGRTMPNTLDLGVALAAGVAAAFANTRRSIANALPGVAISVALVPPLSVVGIGLSLGKLGTEIAFTLGVSSNIVRGSFLLFITNLAGIIFSASLVFLFQGYGNLKKASIGLTVSLFFVLILFQPLGFSLRQLYIKSIAIPTVLKVRQHHPDLFPGTAKFLLAKSWYGKDGVLQLELEIKVPTDDMVNIQEKVDLIGKELSKILQEPVNLDLDIIPFRRFESQL